MLPVAVPGLATALALILAYGTWREFRTSWVFILVGHVLFTLPFMVRAVLAVLSSIDLRTLEEGAASLGAGFWARFTGVVLPNCRGGILAGALMVLTLSVGEFNMTWMLHTPLTKTLPVGLADSYASMRLEIGSAYTLTIAPNATNKSYIDVGNTQLDGGLPAPATPTVIVNELLAADVNDPSVAVNV